MKLSKMVLDAPTPEIANFLQELDWKAMGFWKGAPTPVKTNSKWNLVEESFENFRSA